MAAATDQDNVFWSLQRQHFLLAAPTLSLSSKETTISDFFLKEKGLFTLFLSEYINAEHTAFTEKQNDISSMTLLMMRMRVKTKGWLFVEQ